MPRGRAGQATGNLHDRAGITIQASSFGTQPGLSLLVLPLCMMRSPWRRLDRAAAGAALSLLTRSSAWS
jgi:hypothetical protein